MSNGGDGSQGITAAAIAAVVNGILLGDAETVVTAVAPLERAGPHELTFLAAAKYAPLLALADRGVLLVSPELAATEGNARARVVVARPQDALLAVMALLYPAPPPDSGIHGTAVIGKGTRLGDAVSIGAYTVLGSRVRIGAGTVLGSHVSVGDGVNIGERCELAAGVTLCSGTTLHDRVRIHAGARLGSDGFGYVFRNGAHEKIPHVGRCVIESDVEIGANTTIDRGSIDDTVIGAGTRIDNLVQIGHNVRIGKLCLIMSQVGVAGSAHIEDGCILAGQVGIAGHLTIGRGARLAGQAGVFGDVPAGETWSGYPARPHRDALRSHAAMFKLPSILRALQRLVAEHANEDA